MIEAWLLVLGMALAVIVLQYKKEGFSFVDTVFDMKDETGIERPRWGPLFSKSEDDDRHYTIYATPDCVEPRTLAMGIRCNQEMWPKRLSVPYENDKI
jgi:hypothetical protein